MNVDVSEKGRLWKAWKNGGNKEKSLFLHIADYDPQLFRLAKQMSKVNQDVVGQKYIRDNAGNLSFSESCKKTTWKQHYGKLLNVEYFGLRLIYSP